ncbi:MAG TPA: hypothetical protein VF062_05130 [Candidatus Limnocylindrales bacterium]
MTGAVWSLRILTSLVTLLVLVQPVLAGLFVTGDVGMLTAHSITASFLAALAFFQIVAAIVVWRPGRGPAWPIWASVASFLLLEIQAGLGYARAVGAHIPFGVLLFGLSVAMLIGVWSPRLRQRRS